MAVASFPLLFVITFHFVITPQLKNKKAGTRLINNADTNQPAAFLSMYSVLVLQFEFDLKATPTPGDSSLLFYFFSAYERPLCRNPIPWLVKVLEQNLAYCVKADDEKKYVFCTPYVPVCR